MNIHFERSDKMNTLLSIYRRFVPKHKWEYSKCRNVRTCQLTGAIEARYWDDWGGWWEAIKVGPDGSPFTTASGIPGEPK